MRATDVGIEIGTGRSGPLNAITDVEGVRVGYSTIVHGEGDMTVGQGPVRTGVTVVLPHGGRASTEPVFAGYHRLNGFGEPDRSRVAARVGHALEPHRPDQHRQRRRRARLPHRPRDPGAGADADHAAGRRRDVGRHPQRHQRPARHPRARACRLRRRAHRRHRRGQRRWRHGHAVLRLQGRHRHGLAGRRPRRPSLHGGRPRPGQPRRPQALRGQRRARRPCPHEEGRALPPHVRDHPGPAAGHGFGARRRRDRRAPAPPPGSTGWPSAPGSASRSSAPAGTTTPATS